MAYKIKARKSGKIPEGLRKFMQQKKRERHEANPRGLSQLESRGYAKGEKPYRPSFRSEREIERGRARERRQEKFKRIASRASGYARKYGNKPIGKRISTSKAYYSIGSKNPAARSPVADWW